MNRSFLSVMILLTVLALAACNRNKDDESSTRNGADPAAAQASESAPANPATDSAFDSSFEGALPPTNQMMLGILRLEDTEHAVTSAQAAAMLPLWQALQSGSIQNQSERVAILRQLEGQFTQPQVEAISALQLTFADMNDWAEANGIELPQFGQGGQGSQGGHRAPPLDRAAQAAYSPICLKRSGRPFARRCKICRPNSVQSVYRNWVLKSPQTRAQQVPGPARQVRAPAAASEF